MNPLQVLTNLFSSSVKDPSQELIVRVAKVSKAPPHKRVIFPQDSSPEAVMICQVALDQMFRKSFFDICTVRDCRALVSSYVTSHSESVYERLRILHCVQYSRMPKEIYDKLPDMISEVFVGTPIDEMEVIDVYPSQV